VLGCLKAGVRVADVCLADSKSEVVDTHTHLGTKIAPCVSCNRVCTEPGGTGFRHKIRLSQKITRKAFFLEIKRLVRRARPYFCDLVSANRGSFGFA